MARFITFKNYYNYLDVQFIYYCFIQIYQTIQHIVVFTVFISSVFSWWKSILNKNSLFYFPNCPFLETKFWIPLCLFHFVIFRYIYRKDFLYYFLFISLSVKNYLKSLTHSLILFFQCLQFFSVDLRLTRCTVTDGEPCSL